ncbi:MAG: DUF533 domain-containing protein [Lysobacteraceae bacterium]
MFDPERLLGQVIGGGLGIGGRRSRKTANRAALGVGLLGIAMAAYEHYSQQSKSPAGAPAAAPPPVPGAVPTATSSLPSSPPPPPPAAVPDDAQRQADALLMLRAMIAAANADGHIDDSEREAILGRAREAGLDADDISALERELAAPWPVAALAAATQPAMRERVYLAARLAIDPDHPAEQRFLDELASGVELDGARRAELDGQISSSETTA